MSVTESQTGDVRLGGFAIRAILASFVILAAAGGLMWWRFGPAIFVDLLAALQSCF